MTALDGAIVLGVDPGTATLGFAIVADVGRGALKLIECGAVKTSPRDDLGSRLCALHDRLADVIARTRPTELAIERLFFSRNVTSALGVGQARGVAVLAAAQAGLTVHEYTPAEVKQAVAQYGNARKEQIQEMTRVILGLSDIPRPDDAADAAAIAICHQHSRRAQILTGRMGS